MQKVKPILFNTEMVEAEREGRKTVTRRIIKLQPTGKVYHYTGYRTDYWGEEKETSAGTYLSRLKMPYEVGDILYVRETWRVKEASYPPGRCVIEYKAGGTQEFDEIVALPSAKGEWRPSIHMPKKAARTFLRVTSVRAERLKDILNCKGEVAKEGVLYEDEGDVEASGLRFKALWNSTVKPDDLPHYGWNANPWVWVVEFERCERPEGTEGRL